MESFVDWRRERMVKEVSRGIGRMVKVFDGGSAEVEEEEEEAAGGMERTIKLVIGSAV